MISMSQILSEYHRKIPRIPHGSQHPSKRYLTNKQILELFNGEVLIQEKVDGKLMGYNTEDGKPLDVKMGNILAMEDMTGKNTIHNHVMEYSKLPDNKRIILDKLTVKELPNDNFEIEFYPTLGDRLTYAKVNLENPTLVQIHTILSAFALMPSHFGSDFIEGLVIKNYREQLMAKWVNDMFEDELP